ncbi:hypothetical protein [Paenibacillus sp. LHD-38]|uniref:hypothetical protein n=1 Tax=Paenibacillus sp. LHD-38 TaxID=3072143 RepID=UPI00280E8374|nr:hypothetical protein [Paenibacillus sp. LHD-38]MDQ8735043.1 hypothetical protein [Paenibacillus sp. LHD-38]
MLTLFKDHVADRNIPVIRKFINSYVEKVIVYKEYEVLILRVAFQLLRKSKNPQPHAVVDLHGGGEGI